MKKFTFSLALEWGLFLYVVIGFAISHLLPIPEVIKSLLSLPAWLIIPYFFGSCFRLALRRFRIDSFMGFDGSLFSLLFGIYALIVFSFLLDLLGLSVILVSLYLVLLGVAFIYLMYKTLRNVEDDFPLNAKLIKTYMPIFIFCILVSMIPAVIRVSASPFPYGTIEVISIPFVQYQPALRFMEFGYLQIPRIYDFVSIGFTSQLFKVDPLSFIWATPFLLMAIFSVGLYLFSYSITKNKGFALLTVFIGSFLNLYVFRDVPLLFHASIFLYIFLPYILYLSYKNIGKKEYRLRDVIIALILLTLVVIFYIYLIESNVWSMFVPESFAYPSAWQSYVWLPIVVVSSAPVLFIVCYLSKVFIKNNFLADNALILMFAPFFCLAFQNSESYALIFFIFAFILIFFIAKNKKMRWLLYIFIAFVLGFVLFQHYISAISTFNPISSVILPQYAIPNVYSFSLRFSWIFEYNLSLILIGLLIVGVAVSLFSKKKEDVFIISVFLLALFLYLFPETYAYRFFKELTISMAFIISIGVWRIFHALVDSKKKYSTFIFSVLIIILLLPSLIAPVYQRYYQSTLGQSIVSDYEYSASTWLRTHTPENAILISDFETMQLLGPLSNKMLPVQRYMVAEGLGKEDTQTLWYIKNLVTSSSLNYPLVNVNGSQFWRAYGFGAGSIGVKVDNSSQELNNGTQQISLVPGSKSTVGLIHTFDKNQDWKNASGLYINWCGRDTHAIWQICVAAPDDLNWFAFDFVDNGTGWQIINFPFNAFGKVDSPNWSTISYLAVRTNNEELGDWLIGEVGLSYSNLSFNFTSSDVNYFKTHVSLTDNLYSERTGISMDNASIMFILTPRAVQWFKQEGISGIGNIPQGSVNPTYLELFTENTNVHLIYSYKDEIFVFEAT